METGALRVNAVEARACPNCDRDSARKTFETDEFDYGSGVDAVRLTAHIPVWKCAHCGFQFTDFEAEERKHDAVCRHFGLLTPDEIRSLRKSYNLTVDQFAQLTGIGVASLKRWESGYLLQNNANDKYLRLLQSAENIARLKNLNEEKGALGFNKDNVIWGEFRTKFDHDAIAIAERWELRRTV